MIHSIGQQEERLAEREQAVSHARAALRAERDQIIADRAEAERLLAEARAANQEADRKRDRAHRLASRLIRRVKHRHAEAHRQLESHEDTLANERDRLNADLARLFELRSEFHTTAAGTRDRLRDAWAVVETHQKRATDEWAEAERYFTEQTAQLDAREARLARREKAVADQHARREGDIVELREEAVTLEARADNARKALAELERHRDRVRAELLGTESAPDLAALAPREAGDTAEREAALAREKTAVAALRASLDCETADIDDRKRVLAEQFALLSNARTKWQAVERQTMIEMEQMAHELGRRETEIDIRERRVIHADRRRRDEAYDLWQLRLRLEAWQTKLTAFELRSQTERQERESDLERRTTNLIRRETDIEELFAKWENARESERGRLRAELEHWAIDRQRLAKAAHDFEFQRQLLDAELSTCAARAMAAEELFGESIHSSGSERMKRRLTILQRRWERLFDRKVRAIELRRADASAELAALDERYRQIHRLLGEVVEREGTLNNNAAAAELQKATAESLRDMTPAIHPDTAAAEMAGLRNEVERLAGLVINLELPEPIELPEYELPWGAEELQAPTNVFQFDSSARAA